MTHIAKSLFTPFEQEYASDEADIKNRSNDVKEEMRIASEQVAHRERDSQILYRS